MTTAFPAVAVVRPPLFLPNAKAGERFYEFFAFNIRNRNTRRAL
ncbi:MAG TPA: hypothetical protein VGZ00_01670 [Candidatus Baltobacteraceae bacterium]|nr:hypothetical protein [Candidatus Baltobacteraceae bacterium]